MGRPLHLCTVEEYRAAYPGESRAIEMVAKGPCAGDVVTRYFQGNDDRALMGCEVVGFTYINGWAVEFREAPLPIG